MRLQQLVYFVKVVETGGANSAARELFVSQPAVSAGIRELEEELGVKVAPEELLYIGQNESKVDTVFYGKPFRNHETSAVYVLDRTGVSDRFILQESEVEEVKWMNFETCRECLEDPEFLNCIMGNEMDLLQRYFEEK